MKILHVVGGDIEGGAAKGALVLHEALLRNGIQSRYLIQVGSSDPSKEVYSLNDRFITGIEQKIITKADRVFPKFFQRSYDLFSMGLFGLNITVSSHYKWADVIHLHWICNGTLSINEIKRIKKPVVWTLRDMWAFTGGCHYALTCTKYQSTCGKCPKLYGGFQKDISSLLQAKKVGFNIKNITFVAISEWLALIAKESHILKDADIKFISNNISDTFKRINKAEARKALNLGLEKNIVLVGANNLKNEYKGFTHALKTIEKAVNHIENLHILVFGSVDHAVLEEFKHFSTHFGFVTSEEKMNLLYSASDCFLFTSVQEAFGKTIVESLASGTPVVAFNASAPKYMLKHKNVGFLATPYNSESLYEGICWALSEKGNLNLRKYCSDYVDNHFNKDKSVRLYTQLYQEKQTAK